MPRHPYSKNTPGSRYNLINERLYRGLTQKQVADKIHISRTAYTQIESGERPGAYYIWDAIEELFDRDQAFLKLQFETE